MLIYIYIYIYAWLAAHSWEWPCQHCCHDFYHQYYHYYHDYDCYEHTWSVNILIICKSVGTIGNSSFTTKSNVFTIFSTSFNTPSVVPIYICINEYNDACMRKHYTYTHIYIYTFVCVCVCSSMREWFSTFLLIRNIFVKGWVYGSLNRVNNYFTI